MTWATFRTRFLEKYFPDNARHEREVEFLTLQQGTMTMEAYIERSSTLHVSTLQWSLRSGGVGSSRGD